MCAEMEGAELLELKRIDVVPERLFPVGDCFLWAGEFSEVGTFGSLNHCPAESIVWFAGEVAAAWRHLRRVCARHVDHGDPQSVNGQAL